MYDFVDQIFVSLPKHIFDALCWIIGLAGFHVPDSWLVPFAMILKVVAMVAIFPGIFAFTTWVERKALARIQNRLGPNRTGPVGLFQPIADGLKTLTKEDIIPAKADKFVHTLAPILLVIPAFIVLSVIPMGRNMTAADLNIGVFFFFAAGAISEVSIFMAGWSSHNKYSLLGGMRAMAQMISYEIPFVMSALTVIMIVGSLSTNKIVEAQILHYTIEEPETAWFFQKAAYHLFNNIGGWFVFQPWGFLGFLIFFTAGLAELNRAPFDIPEAESEIIAGHHTEYSGFKFALFAIGEYISMMAVCALGVTLFLGGWAGPKILPSWAWVFIKMYSLMMLMIWIRGTFPRLRVDQLMGFAWKFMLPLSLINMLAAGIWFYIPSRFIAWIATFALLAMAYQILSKLVAGKKMEKRTYHFA